MKTLCTLFFVACLSIFPDIALSQTLSELDRTTLRSAVMEEANALLEPRIEALEIDKKTFEGALDNLQLFGWLIVVFGAVLTFFGLRMLSDVKSYAKLEAERTINDLVASSKSENNALAALVDKVREARQELDDLKPKLVGYAALAIAEVASQIDPLVEYYALRAEVLKRRPKTIASRMGKTVETVETTDDQIFRQRAAVVFERLLASIRTDQGARINRLGSVELFNAAFVASEADMDFVSVQLMEAAAAFSGDIPVEIEARLIRQLVSLSRIPDQQAVDRLAKVLQRTAGFDIHLVASEAFNISLMIARPSEIAMLVMDNINPDLYGNSYVLLNGARMMSMGSTQQDWDTGRDWAIKGVAAFLNEPQSVRWYESSQKEIRGLRSERPDIPELFGDKINDKLGLTSRSEGPTADEFLTMLRNLRSEMRQDKDAGNGSDNSPADP